MSAPYRHSLYGLAIECPFPLPGAPTLEAFPLEPDLSVHWQPDTDWVAEAWRVTLPAASPAQPDIGVTRDGGAGLAWGEEIRFVVSPDHRRVCIFCRAAKLEFVPTVFIGFVLGFVLYLRGVTCLHGAVLEHQGQAFALLGDGGAGKSTLAAALVQSGARLWSDDLVVIPRSPAGARVERGSGGLRLMTTAAEKLLGATSNLAHVPYLDKRLWDMSGQPPPSQTEGTSLPLRALFVLAPREDGDDGVVVGCALAPSESLRQMIAAWYPPGCLPLLNQDHLAEMQRLSHRLPLHVVRYKKTWEQLHRLVETLLA